VEIALAIAWRARSGRIPLLVQLVTGRDGLLPTLARGARAHVRRWLPARRVRLIEDDAVELLPGEVRLRGGDRVASDASLLAIGTAAAPWPRASGLAVDRFGFIGTNDRLQSLSHPFVFAAGDCASMIDHPRPRSGVYAVRAGPPLAANLRRALADEPLAPYVPQRRALYLLATGGRHAIGAWGGLSFAGEWVWRWKDRIDRAFVAGFAR
jgi:selenide,water dikinase